MKSLSVVIVCLMALVPFQSLASGYLGDALPYKNQKANYLYASAGFTSSAGMVIDDSSAAAPISGIISLGVDYEMMQAQDFGLGGYFKYNNTSDDNKPTGKYEYSMISIGGFARFHIPHRSWNFYISPGFGFAKAEMNKQDSGFALSSSMAMGILYHYRKNFIIGIENARTWGLGSKLNGLIADDFVFKVRYQL